MFLTLNFCSHPHLSITLVTSASFGQITHFWLRVMTELKSRSKTRRSTNRAAAIFCMVAVNIGKTQTALGAFYRRRAARVGKAKAVTATARHGKAYANRSLGTFPCTRDVLLSVAPSESYCPAIRERGRAYQCGPRAKRVACSDTGFCTLGVSNSARDSSTPTGPFRSPDASSETTSPAVPGS